MSIIQFDFNLKLKISNITVNGLSLRLTYTPTSLSIANLKARYILLDF